MACDRVISHAPVSVRRGSHAVTYPLVSNGTIFRSVNHALELSRGCLTVASAVSRKHHVTELSERFELHAVRTAVPVRGSHAGLFEEEARLVQPHALRAKQLCLKSGAHGGTVGEAQQRML